MNLLEIINIKNEFHILILKAKEKAKESKYWANWYRVYGLGLVGFLEGTVFENWKEGAFDNSLIYAYGMDFGFSPDPTTLIKVALDKKNKLIYLKEYAYATGLSNQDIINICKEHIKNNDLLICDSAEKREINEIIRSGINCIRSRKGKDSVRTGIKLMMDYTIVVDPKSQNAKKELRNYIWNDKTAGIPKDNNNHIIDPARYCFDFLKNC